MSCVNCEKIKRETHWGPIQKTTWQSPKLLMGLTHSELPQIQTLLSLFNQDTLFKRRLCNAALMQDLTKYHMMPHLKGLFSFSFAWLALSLQKECPKRLIWMVWCHRDWMVDTFQGCEAVKSWINSNQQRLRDTKVHNVKLDSSRVKFEYSLKKNWCSARNPIKMQHYPVSIRQICAAVLIRVWT